MRTPENSGSIFHACKLSPDFSGSIFHACKSDPKISGFIFYTCITDPKVSGFIFHICIAVPERCIFIFHICIFGPDGYKTKITADRSKPLGYKCDLWIGKEKLHEAQFDFGPQLFGHGSSGIAGAGARERSGD